MEPVSAIGHKLTLDVTPEKRERRRGTPMPFGKAPCEACIHKPECETRHLACGDFAHFVECGKVRNKDREPTREAFARLFGG
jgi:hypothetical protein